MFAVLDYMYLAIFVILLVIMATAVIAADEMRARKHYGRAWSLFGIFCIALAMTVDHTGGIAPDLLWWLAFVCIAIGAFIGALATDKAHEHARQQVELPVQFEPSYGTQGVIPRHESTRVIRSCRTLDTRV